MASRPYIAVGLAVVSVSFSSIFIVWSESPPITIAMYRLAIATAILAPFAVLRRDARIFRVSRRDAFLMVLVGAILAAHFGLWVTSLKVQGVTVASSTILVTSHPLMVGLLSHFVLRERLSRRTGLGIVLGFGGVVVIALADLGVSGETLVGDVLAFLGGIGAGFYFLFGRRIRQRVALVDYAFVVYASATGVLFAVAIALGTGLEPRGEVPRELLLFLGMAVIPQIGGHTLYNWSLRWVPAPVVSLSLVGEPIGSSLLAWAILPQAPSAAVGVGGVFALLGIYLAASAEGGGVGAVEAARDVE